MKIAIDQNYNNERPKFAIVFHSLLIMHVHLAISFEFLNITFSHILEFNLNNPEHGICGKIFIFLFLPF